MSKIYELFGFSPSDKSKVASFHRENLQCPFINQKCQKTLSDGTISGMCTLKPSNSGPVICCPIRLYGDNYKVLLDVAETAFGNGKRLIHSSDVSRVSHDGNNVVVFGKGWGKELRLPKREGSGAYFVDWILSSISNNGKLKEFVAVEVQTIDTTGNYRGERESILKNKIYKGRTTAGLNWENVNKRIMPQLIYKGHVLRRERLCTKGLFFICPTPVYSKIISRLGSLLEYGLQPGSLSFRWYNIADPDSIIAGKVKELVPDGQFTSTIDQVYTAFSAPSNLPEAGVYEKAIRQVIENG